MQTSDPPREGRQFLRFCLVGGIGFVTDTAALLGLVHGAEMGLLPAKVLSFAVAVVVTFQLNRVWAFGGVREGGIGRAFAAYLGVQGTGALCNVAVFAALTALLPKPFDDLVLCAAAASGAALLVNYLGASRLVFGLAGGSGPGRFKP